MKVFKPKFNTIWHSPLGKVLVLLFLGIFVVSTYYDFRNAYLGITLPLILFIHFQLFTKKVIVNENSRLVIINYLYNLQVFKAEITQILDIQVENWGLRRMRDHTWGLTIIVKENNTERVHHIQFDYWTKNQLEEVKSYLETFKNAFR